MENIQLFRPYFRVEECLSEIRECLEKGWTGIGFKTVEFEKKWVEYTGLPHAHYLNSATAGLHLSVKILKESQNWNSDAEIITTPLTFVSTNHAILYEKLNPVFADIDKSLNLSPVSVESKITDKTKAVIFVGMGGSLDNLLDVASICKKYNLKLILDAAHMGGSRLGGKHVGFEADVAVFSYQAVKNLPTADSGMICFKEEAMDKKARELAWLGINKDTYSRTSSEGAYKWKYDVNEVGYKYHGNSIIASMGIVALKYLDEDNVYRRNLSKLYIDKLKNNSKIEIVQHTMGESSRHLFQILVENRENIIFELNKKKIFPGVHYRINTDYKPFNYAINDCPNAREFSEKLLSLPLHVRLKETEIEFISQSLLEIVGK